MENNTDKPDVALCEGCHKNPASEPHTCPYSEELYDDKRECTCCDKCATECAMDI
jgi:hypothetical protein